MSPLRRQNSLYFTLLSIGEALRLVAGAAGTLVTGAGFASLTAIETFERAWCQRFGCPDAVAFPSARSGLYGVLRVLGVGAGDEVILTGYTCVAVPDAVRYTGATPVYADIDARTYSIRPELVEGIITGRTRAIVAQHTYGIPADMERLVALARKNSIHIIEDAALALGSAPKGRQVGGHGQASIFSFELSKTISAGWGGIVQLNDELLAEDLRHLRARGGFLPRWSASRRQLQAGLSRFLYSPRLIGPFGYLLAALFRVGLFQRSAERDSGQECAPDGFLAAPASGHWSVLSSQLGRLEAAVRQSRSTTGRYTRVLEERDLAHAGPTRALDGASLIRFPLQVREPDRAIAFFARQGIELGRWFDYPISERPADLSMYNYIPGQCPVAERVADHVINLPLHTRMSSGDVDRACSTLERYLDLHPNELRFIGEEAPVALGTNA